MPVKQPRLKISDYSEKRKIKLWSKSKKAQILSLSLTSLVDVFAILVIYLLINQTTLVEWISVSNDIELPKAKSTEIPPKSLSIQISKTTVSIDGQPIDKVENIMKKGDRVQTIANWLKLESNTDANINIIAHGQLPYLLVKKVIKTCRLSKFSKVNLIVQPSVN